MDYRASHQDPSKVYLYEESFARYPYRRIVWEWEKDILNSIVLDISRRRTRLKYLDFACGTGRILRVLEKYMEEAHGVDVSASMLNVAKEKNQHSSLWLCDLTKEDIFPENYFDLITAFRFFLNAQQELRESVLGVFRKILKRNGHLIINIHMNKGCLLEKELKVYQSLKNISNVSLHSISVQETRDLLRKFDFNVIQTFHYGVLPIYRDEHKPFINEINRIEKLCSKIPSLLPLSRYVIYVCGFQGQKNPG